MTRWREASFVVAVVTAGPAWAQPPDRYYGPGMMWDGGIFHMFFSLLMTLLFIGVIAVVVVLAVRWLGSSEHSPFRHPPGAPPRAALDILKERLARGEIDVAEYEERKRALGE